MYSSTGSEATVQIDRDGIARVRTIEVPRTACRCHAKYAGLLCAGNLLAAVSRGKFRETKPSLLGRQSYLATSRRAPGETMTDTDDPNAAERRQYPSDYGSLVGQESAVELLVEWAGEACQTHPHLEIQIPSPQWSQLLDERALQGWIFCASREPAIAMLYGTSESPMDPPFWGLADEAFKFLNSLLGRAELVSLADVRREAQEFWLELASMTQEYEVGAFLHNVIADVDSDLIPLGPAMALHRVTGPWASERFVSDVDLPANRWAVTATVEQKRTPYGHPPDFQAPSFDVVERTAIQWAHLPFRLSLKPSFTHGNYRIGLKGVLNPPVRQHVRSDHLIDESLCIQLSSDEMSEIAELGRLLEQKLTSVSSILAADVRDPLGLALQRFQAAWHRTNWQDRVLDLAIALESMFADDNQEVAHKVATRSALLLGTSPTDSKRIMSTVKRFYDLRSKIVHGSPSQGVREARRVIEVWRGYPDQHAQSSSAATIGGELVGRALQAFLRLETEAGLWDGGHIKEIDDLAFDQNRRLELQQLAKVSPVPPLA